MKLSTSLIAVLAVLSVATYASEVLAKPAPPPPGPCAQCGGNGGGGDTGGDGNGDKDPTGVPTTHPTDGGGDTPPPPDIPPPPDKPGDPKDPKTPPPVYKLDVAENVCNGALGKLRKVTEAQVLAYSFEPGVKIVPVCESSSLLRHKAEIDPSQALQVRDEIAQNAALEGPLGARGYRSDDVVGVVIMDGAAVLYVHKGA